MSCEESQYWWVHSIQFNSNAAVFSCKTVYGPLLMKFSVLFFFFSGQHTDSPFFYFFKYDGNISASAHTTLPISSFIYFISFFFKKFLFVFMALFYFYLFICLFYFRFTSSSSSLFHAIYCISLASPSHCAPCSCLILFKMEHKTA